MTTANLPKHVVAKFDIFISLSLQRSGHDIAKDFCLCLSKTCDLEIDIDRLPHNDLVCSMKIQKCLDVILQKSCTPQQSRLHLWQPNSTNDTSITAKEIKQTTKITKSAMPPPPKQQKCNMRLRYFSLRAETISNGLSVSLNVQQRQPTNQLKYHENALENIRCLSPTLELNNISLIS